LSSCPWKLPKIQAKYWEKLQPTILKTYQDRKNW
jgi:hypothetical protein